MKETVILGLNGLLLCLLLFGCNGSGDNEASTFGEDRKNQCITVKICDDFNKEQNEMKEFLREHGLSEYQSQSLTLKSMEDIIYVPIKDRIDIYYQNRYCGYLSVAYFGAYETPAIGGYGFWGDDKNFVKSVLSGATTLYEDIVIDEESSIDNLVLATHRRECLFQGADTYEWLLEKQHIKNNKDANLDMCLYEVVYGVEGSEYGYYMRLSTFFVDEELLNELVRLVCVNEYGALGEDQDVLNDSGITLDMPQSVLYGGNVLRWPDNNYDGAYEFAFSFEVGDSVWEIPEGTIALDKGDKWTLYAYVGYSYSEIGTIYVYSEIDSVEYAETILKQYLQEQGSLENVIENDAGFVYIKQDKKSIVYSIYDENSQEMLIVEHYPET